MDINEEIDKGLSKYRNINTQKNIEVNLTELSKFLVDAKKATYASNANPIKNQERIGFKELVYENGLWSYRDSYVGFYYFSGTEVVKYDGNIVWNMSYAGGMNPAINSTMYDKKARTTFRFLRKALSLVTEDRPFRGPTVFKDGNLEYLCGELGDIKDFFGVEEVFYKNHDIRIYRLRFLGGLIRPK